MMPWLLALALVLAPDPGDPAPSKKPAKQKTPSEAVSQKEKESGHKDVGTLEAITIEGEIDVPEVLFITASDRPRFHDGLHRRYLPAAREVARETVLPARLAVRLDP